MFVYAIVYVMYSEYAEPTENKQRKKPRKIFFDKKKIITAQVMRLNDQGIKIKSLILIRL